MKVITKHTTLTFLFSFTLHPNESLRGITLLYNTFATSEENKSADEDVSKSLLSSQHG